MKMNPHWTRDELILALDLYFTVGRRQPDPNEPDVIALSELLHRLPIHPLEARALSFRSPMSVSMKLGNFLAIDPAYQGLGLYRGSLLDRQIWDDFASDPARLHRTALAIHRARTLDEAQSPALPEEDLDETFPEGRILTRLHLRRERNQRLVKRKKEQVLRETGRLACEVCDFDFASTYGDLGAGVAECHHLIPLAELPEQTETRLSDLAVVCANCHRILHRGDPPPTMAELRALVEVNHQSAVLLHRAHDGHLKNTSNRR